MVEQVDASVQFAPLEHREGIDADTVTLTTTYAVIPSGIYTIRSPFGHRTFSVERQAADAEFAAGRRMVYLFEAAGHERKWTPFGFVADGAVKWPIGVWTKHRGTDFETYGNLLTHMIVGGFRRFTGPDGEPHPYEIMLSRRCFRCDRRLTDPESIERGIGPECRKKGAH